ncbi:MAG: DNA polymerase beta domain protein region [Parcubacteria bacterium 34_609]|jgi:predicted nucleotidyltransferase|nr:MAG: DNA polymerase beta domain protein region [Parcubacteria bacterium 34_609]KUK97344.1 MAG: DNA polymerase beta domain protein region [Parcubacteria bacterium 32_520]
MNKEIKKIKLEIAPILKKHQVKRASVFGSYARGENNKNSDIDILVELERGKTMIDLINLEMDIEKKTKRKIDLITFKSINPLIKKNILRDEVKIYG